MKIFATVGTHTPFDRLVSAIDRLAEERPAHAYFVQVGQGIAPIHAPSAASLGSREFEAQVAQADLLIGHAGIGTLFAALEAAKPIIVMPRRAALRETRNDHQLATAVRFKALELVHVVHDFAGLLATFDHLVERPASAKGTDIDPSTTLLNRIATFVDDAPPRAHRL